MRFVCLFCLTSLCVLATKIGAVVAGQTSVKEPEIKAFEKYLPPDIVVNHKCDIDKYKAASEVLHRSLRSELVPLNSYLEHDQITADTQAVTHLAFLSMGTAWKNCSIYPWRSPSYVGGIENVKVLTTLRIYSNKWHVYAGLAILNPSAQQQVQQYASSVSSLLKLMIQEKGDELMNRIREAGNFVFGNMPSSILLSDELLEEFSLSQVPPSERKPNSHLSLLAMMDSWLWLGIVEYLFKNTEMFESAIHAAIHNKEHSGLVSDIRSDDLEFCLGVREWATVINESNFEGYRRRFESASTFFADQLLDGQKLSARMIQKLIQKTKK